MTVHEITKKSAKIYLQSDIDDSPGTPFDTIALHGDVEYPKIDRGKQHLDGDRSDGEFSEATQNYQVGGQFGFKTRIRGKGSGAGDSVVAVDGESSILYNAFFGNGEYDTGETSESSNAVDSIKATDTSFTDASSTTRCPSAIMMTSTDGGYEAREVETVSTGTPDQIAPCRDFTDAPEDSAIIYASSAHWIEPDNPDHDHVYFTFHDSSDKQIHYGGALTLVQVFDGGAPGFAINEWGYQSSYFDDDSGLSFPAFSAPTTKKGIAIAGSRLWWGTSERVCAGFRVEYNLVPVKRISHAAQSLVNGFVYTMKTPPVVTVDTEFDRSVYQKANDASGDTVDILYQCGSPLRSDAPANTALVRAQNAQIMDAEPYETDGQKMMKVTLHACRPTSGVGSVRFHQFASAA